MKYSYIELKKWIKTRSIREQWLVFFIGFMLIYLLWYLIVDHNIQNLIHAKKNEIEALNMQIEKSKQQFSVLTTIIESPDFLKMIAENEDVRKKQYVLSKVSSGLVKVSDLSKIIHDVLKQQGQFIQLNSYKIEQGQLWNPKNFNKQLISNQPIYQYLMTLEFKGEYFNTLQFLSRLEKLPWKIYWNNFSYKVIQYPNALVTTQFYVLSTEKD